MAHHGDALRALRVHTARGLALATAAGMLYYISLTIVLGLRWEGYDPVRDTQSELAAVDSPYQAVMNVAGFMVLGLCILAFAGAYTLVLRGGWAKLLTVALLTVAGTGMLVVGFFPCDAGCVDVTRTGRLHGAFSAPAAIGLPAAAMLSAAVFRTDGRLGPAWQASSFWLGLISLASGPVVAIGLLENVNGLLQRAGMWPPLIWTMLVSARLCWLTRPSPPARPREALPSHT